MGSANPTSPLSVCITDAAGANMPAGGVIGSDGVVLPIDSLQQTLGYTSGQLTTIQVGYNGGTYIQTLTYTAGQLTGVSQWVKQ